MKKIILMIVTILLLVGLVGCGENTSSTTKIKKEEENEIILEKDDYLSCIITDGDLAYFDVSLDEFIENYNNIVDNSQEVEYVKAFMYLNETPKFEFTTSDGVDVYNVTNSAIATNRSAVQIAVSTLSGTATIQSINFMIPNTASLDTDITKEFALATIALIGNENADKTDLTTMYEELKSIGRGYDKGLFYGYYKQDSAIVYKISAITKEYYDQIK